MDLTLAQCIVVLRTRSRRLYSESQVYSEHTPACIEKGVYFQKLKAEREIIRIILARGMRTANKRDAARFRELHVRATRDYL